MSFLPCGNICLSETAFQTRKNVEKKKRQALQGTHLQKTLEATRRAEKM